MAWETVIGLEVHVELSTKSKIFCGCSTAYGGAPNSNTCVGCQALPGTLPVLNKAVCDKAIAAGLALGCAINEHSLFDRKHYFYPDLTKSYQLSQYFHHLCTSGRVAIKTKDGEKEIRVNRIHVEEDAGKLVHEGGYSLVDGNRGSMPLIEIVSEPDIRGADEAEAYLEAIRETLVYLGVSDCKMQEGSMRADINISVREEGSEAFGTRTEMKNMNSFKAIRRAIEFESGRHIDALETGKPLVQETRRWDDNLGKSFSMRNKETAQEYMYFPDPDLPALHVDEAWIARVREALPELAAEKRARYTGDFGLDEKAAGVLTAEKNIAELFDSLVSSLSRIRKERALSVRDAASEAANVVTGDILRLVRESGADAETARVDAEKLATVICLVREKKISRAAGREVIDAVFKTDGDPEKYIAENGLSLIDDEAKIREIAGDVIAKNPGSIEDYKAGKEKAFGFLVGQTMRAFGSKADPGVVNKALRELLEAAGIVIIKPETASGKTKAGAGSSAPSDLSSKELDEGAAGEKDGAGSQAKKTGGASPTSTRYRDMTWRHQALAYRADREACRLGHDDPRSRRHRLRGPARSIRGHADFMHG